MSIAADACGGASSRVGRGESVSLRVSVLSDVQAFRAIRGQLEELTQDLCEPNVFYEPWMLEPAMRHLGGDQHLEFVCIHCADGSRRLCGFFPLVRVPLHERLPLQIYSLWQHPQCFRCAPLIRRGFADRCWAILFDWLRDQPPHRRLLRLERLPGNGGTTQALEAHLARDGSLCSYVQTHESAFLRIADSGDEALCQAMSGKTLAKMRRQQRRLAEGGELVFADIDAASDLEALVDEFLALEAKGWKGARGTAMAKVPGEQAFFREVMTEAFQRDRLSFLTMRLNGRMIAGQSALTALPGSFGFKIAYDEDFSKYSPGSLLEIEKVRRLHERDDPVRPKVLWADSCSAPGNGPASRCWPDRQPVHKYWIAVGHGPMALVVKLLPRLEKAGLIARPQVMQGGGAA